MAAHIKGDEQVVHDMVLADDGAADLLANIGVGRHELLHQGAGFFGIESCVHFTHNVFLFLFITYYQVFN